MEQLITDIQAFLTKNKMRPTTFGELAMNDKAFLIRLEAGRDVRVSTVEKVRQFMADYRAEAA